MNKRVEELKKLGRDKVKALAEKMGVRSAKSTIGTARAIEKREFDDKRFEQKRKHIKDIF